MVIKKCHKILYKHMEQLPHAHLSSSLPLFFKEQYFVIYLLFLLSKFHIRTAARTAWLYCQHDYSNEGGEYLNVEKRFFYFEDNHQQWCQHVKSVERKKNFPNGYTSVWTVSGTILIRHFPLLKKLTKKQKENTACLKHPLMKGFPAGFASMNAWWRKGKKGTAEHERTELVRLSPNLDQKPQLSWNATTILYLPTAFLWNSAERAPPGDERTWQSSMVPVRMTVSSARTGTTGLWTTPWLWKISFPGWMTTLHVFATLGVMQRLRCSTLSRWLMQ